MHTVPAAVCLVVMPGNRSRHVVQVDTSSEASWEWSEGYSTCFVCLCVCLSVTALAATAFVSACNQGIILGLKLVDFRKTVPFKSYGEKKPICILVVPHREPFSRTFWTNETQELLEAQPVSRILLQTLATSAAGVK